MLQNDISMELKIVSGFFSSVFRFWSFDDFKHAYTILNEIQQQSKHIWTICWWYQKIRMHKYIDSEMKNNKFESYEIDVSASNDSIKFAPVFECVQTSGKGGTRQNYFKCTCFIGFYFWSMQIFWLLTEPSKILHAFFPLFA